MSLHINYRTSSPILQLDSKKQLERIRYNKYDFGNQRHLLRNPSLADEFYEVRIRMLSTRLVIYPVRIVKCKLTHHITIMIGVR